MRPIDADEFMEQYNLKDATKYGNKDAEQQNHSYSTLYLYELAGMIDDAPTIDIYGKWIPCSDRLPEERDWYIAVFREIDTGFQLIPKVADYIGFETEYTTRDGWQFQEDIGKYGEYEKILECVAWAPLPEPYKGE